ncbi:hypothetical protein [Actinopolymorpha rutila]|uniref:Uncharacterized protein n=1 Tax=Actinopolymorpha rutila TaxID=446787 RepID=A0A852Z823_9ACTN|nr:hypothetical protein [Actinopolymorpha rutila]NYH88375.1 hypothetical protein [Actinopolymorpha rutila]
MRRWLLATLAITFVALGLSAPAANAQPLDIDTAKPARAVSPLFSYDCSLEADPPVFGVGSTRIIGYVTAKCEYPLPAGMIVDAYIEQHTGNAQWTTIKHAQSKKIAKVVTVDVNFPCSASNPVRRTVRTVGTLRAWKFGHAPESVRVVSGVVTRTC